MNNLFRTRNFFIGFILIAFIGIFVSCGSENTMKMEYEQNCSKPTIKDPNEVKPMARMMRTMVNYCDTMRIKINAGEKVDSLAFPLMPFWTAEPTDSSVLGDLYYNNAKQFATAYRNLMSDTLHQRENYALVINQCQHCHNSFCSGPLKRIKKLTLDYKEE